MGDVVEICGLTRSAGGLFYAISSVTRELARAGVNIDVLGPQAPHLAEDIQQWGDSPVHSYKTVGPLQSTIGLRRLLKNIDPKLVHVHGIWTDNQWASLEWQRRSGGAVVISPHGMLDPWALNHSAWKKRLAGKLFANQSLEEASCIHALCRSEVESVRNYGLSNPIAQIPNGVDLPVLGKSCKGEKKRLLFLGRIHPKKGISELLHAWCKLDTDWQLIIAGWDDGGHDALLRRLASDLNLDERVKFVGPQYGVEKERLFRSADAFILPSFSEGLPMAILEAWSYALPVIMTPFCNLPEGFEFGGAIEVQPEVDSILDGLQALTGMSDDAVKKMGIKGRELVEKEFSWARIADEMLQVYRWCEEGGAAPLCVGFE